jgi:hypothetical protein
MMLQWIIADFCECLFDECVYEYLSVHSYLDLSVHFIYINESYLISYPQITMDMVTVLTSQSNLDQLARSEKWH